MISCDQHDYIEIACMYRFSVKLTKKSGEVIEGVALDTALNEHKDECIKVAVNGAERLIVLTELSLLAVNVDNPHFTTLSFV